MGKAREKEIKMLYEKYLAVPKPLRLKGENGVVEIPAVPDQFYLNEVANWISYMKEFAPQNLNKRKFDTIAESKGYSLLEDFDFDIKGSSDIVNKGNNQVTQFETYDSLSINQLLSQEPLDINSRMNSFCIHVFLSKVVKKLYENYNAFITVLSDKFQTPIRSGKYYYTDILELLRKVHNDLLGLEEKGNYDIIPRLHAIRDHGVIMASDLSQVFKYEVEEWGLLYTYSFSHQTAHSFFVVLKDFFAHQIWKYELLQGKSPYDNFRESPEKPDENKFIPIPIGTKEKVKTIRRILNLSESLGEGHNENTNELVVSSFQLMMLLKALQEKGIIKKKIEKYHFALAYEILTGNSSEHFISRYPTGSIDITALKKMRANIPVKRIKTSVTELKEILSKEIIHFFETVEKLPH